MKRITSVLIILILLLFSCKMFSNDNEKIRTDIITTNEVIMPDKILIYKLPSFVDYSLPVMCEDIKYFEETKQISIIDTNEIKDFYTMFNDKRNFIVDTNFHDIDSRMLIEYYSGDKVIKQICWSELKKIQMDGKIFRYSKEIENFLLSKKLISVIIFD